MTKIYVGNLPFSATEAEVRELFEQHGAVESVQLLIDRATNRPRGFGFVEMSPDEAKDAIEALDGKEFGGRPLRVNEARPLTERPAREFTPRRNPGERSGGFGGERRGGFGGDRRGGGSDRGGDRRGGSGGRR